MVQSFPLNGRRHYWPGSSRRRAAAQQDGPSQFLRSAPLERIASTENAREQRMRRIVFSLFLFRLRLLVLFFSYSTESRRNFYAQVRQAGPKPDIVASRDPHCVGTACSLKCGTSGWLSY